MRRVTRNDLQGLFESAPQSLYDDIHKSLAALPDGKRRIKVKKKLNAAFILAAILIVLSAASIAATKLDLFSGMARNAEPIVPLEGADRLVETGLGYAENDWATITVEEAACDGQGVMALVRLTPKDSAHYALCNSWLTDTPDDLYIVESVPSVVPEDSEQNMGHFTIVNAPDKKALYRDGEMIALPTSQAEAVAAELPVFIDDGIMYYSDMWDRNIIARKDGRQMVGFDVSLRPASSDPTLAEQLYSMSINAEEQSDGSVLVWFDTFADEPLPDPVEMKLTTRIWPNGEDDREGEIVDEITFTLEGSEDERVARYIPENGGMIGDHVRVRAVEIRFTPVRAYLTVDYDYESRPDEDMGVWLHLYDADGDPITTGNGGMELEEIEKLGFYRQQGEMQSFDEAPGVIVLEAKVIGGEPLGRCTCKLLESE